MMNIEELRSYIIGEVSTTENRRLLLGLFYTLLKEEGRSYIAVRAGWFRYYFKQLRLFPDERFSLYQVNMSPQIRRHPQKS